MKGLEDWTDHELEIERQLLQEILQDSYEIISEQVAINHRLLAQLARIDAIQKARKASPSETKDK